MTDQPTGPTSSWNLGPDDPAAVLAGARRALFVMVGVLALLWLIQIINWADHQQLAYEYGIKAHDPATLPYIITAPFLHFSWSHIEGNSGPLFIFGFLAAYRGVARFAGLTAIVVLTSGLAAWLFETSGTVGAGASGVVFGYFGYIMVRGLFDRHAIDLLIGAVMALCFAYQFTVLLPHAGIGWQAHIGGLAGGVAGGWLLRDRRRSARHEADSDKSAGGTTTTTAISPPSRPGRTRQGSFGDGPRADLHKQLDDMGL